MSTLVNGLSQPFAALQALVQAEEEGEQLMNGQCSICLLLMILDTPCIRGESRKAVPSLLVRRCVAHQLVYHSVSPVAAYLYSSELTNTT